MDEAIRRFVEWLIDKAGSYLTTVLAVIFLFSLAMLTLQLIMRQIRITDMILR